MKKLLYFALTTLIFASCAKQAAEVPVYVWGSFGRDADETKIREYCEFLKSHGVTGVCINLAWNFEAVEKVSKIVHECGLEYQAMVSTVTQGGDFDKSWYTVNRLGESAYDNPPYVPYYKTLDPHNPEVVDFLVSQFTKLASIPTVDFVQLDYVRYADVILARGLWNKYGLVMDEEYPAADFCYCDDCVAAFKQESGIDIRSFEDPSTCPEWAKWRCDVITSLVNKIADAVHGVGKKISADVFPGPEGYSVQMVRQQWDEWNIDAFFPMNYNDFYLEPAEWVETITKQEVESIAGKNVPLYSGLFICKDWRNKENLWDPEDHGLNPEELKVAINGALSAGATGISLFSTRSMTPEHWASVDEVLASRK